MPNPKRRHSKSRTSTRRAKTFVEAWLAKCRIAHEMKRAPVFPLADILRAKRRKHRRRRKISSPRLACGPKSHDHHRRWKPWARPRRHARGSTGRVRACGSWRESFARGTADECGPHGAGEACTPSCPLEDSARRAKCSPWKDHPAQDLRRRSEDRSSGARRVSGRRPTGWSERADITGRGDDRGKRGFFARTMEVGDRWRWPRLSNAKGPRVSVLLDVGATRLIRNPSTLKSSRVMGAVTTAPTLRSNATESRCCSSVGLKEEIKGQRADTEIYTRLEESPGIMSDKVEGGRDMFIRQRGCHRE